MKKKEVSHYRRYLGRFLKPYRTQFVTSVLLMVLYGATDGAIPFLVKYMLDGIFANKDQSLLYLLPGVVVVFALIRAGLDFGQQFTMSRIGHNIVKDIRNALHARLVRVKVGFLRLNTSADLLSRSTSDVMLIRTLLTEAFAAILRDSVRVVVLLVASIYLDPVLAMVAFVALPLAAWPIYQFGRRMRKLSKLGQDAIGKVSVLLQESVIGLKIIKIFQREGYELDRFRAENEKLTGTFVKSERVRAMTGPVNEILGSLAIAGILVYGGVSVMNGARTQGDFIAFLLSVFLLYDPFKKLSKVNSAVQQGMAGAERIIEVLDAETETEPSMPLPLTSSNSLEFKNVSVKYGNGEHWALRNVNLVIREGQKVALVGLSGAGKTTLVETIPRFVEPTEGVIEIGGVSISDVSLSELRARMALVSQHTFLFNDTIYNNIAYGSPAATKQEVIEAARSANALKFIEKLPNGFETQLGEQGMTLSGGERQRITIARAILKQAPILILDEATASLDNQSEQEVQVALERLEAGRTSIIIAHRLSTIRNADLIVVLKDGEIVERGTHTELIARCGEYANLHKYLLTEDQPKVVENQ